MKNLNKIFLSLLLLLTAYADLFAQNTCPTFSGTFNYDKKSIPDSIAIWTYPNNNFWDTSVDFMIKINKDSTFRFKLPQITKPSMFGIRLMNGGFTTFIGNFYAEPNDQVHIEILEMPILVKDSILFSGKGAEKYTLATKLYDNHIDYLFKKMGRLRLPRETVSPDSLDAYLKNTSKIVRQLTEKRLALINSFNNIAPKMKLLLDYNQPSYIDAWFGDMDYLYKTEFKGNKSYKEKIREYFNQNYSKFVGTLDELSFSAPFRYQVISSKFKINLLINSEKEGVDLKTYYHVIKNSYEGKIRERLLIEFFRSLYTMGDIINYDPIIYDSLVLDASKYLISKSSKAVIAKKLFFKNGKELYNSDFIDLNDITFNINSLKGKVVLIEIWGEGCGACSAFHGKFEKEIWPFLKDNKNFTVLALYNGKTKSRWIKGIESNLYTDKEYINISTLPLGNDHPFLKHYNINYAPFLLLINKQGKIISQISADIKSKELLSLITSSIISNKGSK